MAIPALINVFITPAFAQVDKFHGKTEWGIEFTGKIIDGQLSIVCEWKINNK